MKEVYVKDRERMCEVVSGYERQPEGFLKFIKQVNN